MATLITGASPRLLANPMHRATQLYVVPFARGDVYLLTFSQDVSYVTDTGRCTSSSGSLLDGDRWQAACQKIATDGFACADGQGTCYADSASVKGSCD